MWVLGIELGSSTGAVDAFDSWAIFPAPVLHFFLLPNHIYRYYHILLVHQLKDIVYSDHCIAVMNSDIANIYRQIFIVPSFLSLEYILRNEVPNFKRQSFVQSLEELPCPSLKLGTILPSVFCISTNNCCHLLNYLCHTSRYGDIAS